MPTRTIYYPNRTKKRYFSSCDAARIAREVVKDRGETPEQVLACIAKGFGFTHISLSRQRVVQSSILPSVIRTLPVLIEGAITLLRIFMKKFGKQIAAVKAIIDILNKVKDILDRFLTESPPDQAKVDDIIGDGCKCKT
jgi:hypothetical protein